MLAKLSDLNDDLLLLVLASLSQPDLDYASRVCSHWRALIIQTPWLWRSGHGYHGAPAGTMPLSVLVKRSQGADIALEGVDTALHRQVVAASHRVVSLKMQITSTLYFAHLKKLLMAGLPWLRILHFGLGSWRRDEDGARSLLTTSGVAMALHERNVPSLVELFVFNSSLPLDLIVLPKLERVRLDIAQAADERSLRQLPQLIALRSLLIATVSEHKLPTRFVSPLRHLQHLAFSERNEPSELGAELVRLPILEVECMQDVPVMELILGMRNACAAASKLKQFEPRSTRRGWVISIARWSGDRRFPDVNHGFSTVSIALSCVYTGARRIIHYPSVKDAVKASWDKLLGIREARTVHLDDVVAWTLFCDESSRGAVRRMAQRRVLRLRITLREGACESDGIEAFWRIPAMGVVLVPPQQLRTVIIRAEPFTSMAVLGVDIERMLQSRFGWNKGTKTKLTLVGLEVVGRWNIQLDEYALPDWDEDSEDEPIVGGEQGEDEQDTISEPDAELGAAAPAVTAAQGVLEGGQALTASAGQGRRRRRRGGKKAASGSGTKRMFR